MYAWDDDKNLDKEFHSAIVCDPAAKMGIRQREGARLSTSGYFLEFPSGANFIAVQITFPDGTKGKIWKIENKKKD